MDKTLPEGVVMTDDQIKHMVQRFLSWKLPEHFHPDAGISFVPEFNVEWNAKQGKPPQRHEPVGTNLLDAVQAQAMVRYMVEGLPDPNTATKAGRITEEWRMNMAKLEGGAEVGAGFETISAPNTAPGPPQKPASDLTEQLTALLPMLRDNAEDYTGELQCEAADAIELALKRMAEMEAALKRIESWFGEFPAQTKRRMTHRQYLTQLDLAATAIRIMRELARAALQAKDTPK